MSEEGGGKIICKRQHDPNKPYERRKSLLGKMKDLITPSWLSGLVTTGKPPEENEAQKDDSNFMNTMSPPQGRQKLPQNDARPPPVFVPLDKRNGTPSKVMAPPQSTFISHAKLNQREATHTYRQDQVPLQTGFTSSQLPLIPEKVHDHYGDNDDNISDKSVDSKSTSGCSSMIPHPPSTSQKERVMLELNESDLSNIKDKLLESDEKQQSKLGRSLTWTAQYNTKRPKKPALTGKPSFDVSLFGSPVASSNNTSPLSDRLNESTFYPGRTTYGGAASQRRLNATTPYQSSPFPVRQKMKAKPLNNSFNTTTSGTARKILETLEKMTTPLGDARKIPVDDTMIQSLSSSFSFTPSYRRPTIHSIRSYMNSSRELQIPMKGPPLKKVSTPGSASLAANLQRFTTPDFQGETSTEATSSYQLPGSIQDEHYMSSSNTQHGKMKSKKFSQHIPSPKGEEDEQPFQIPQLRTDFTLPVKDMPAFNFNMPKSSPQFSARPAQDSSSQQYTFSSPLQKMPVTPTDTPTGPSTMEFKFSSPIQGDGSTTPKTKSVTFFLGEEKMSNFNHKAPAVSFNSESPMSQGFTEPVSQPSSNSSSPHGGGLKVASELKTGSVMDILGKSDTSSTESKSSFDGFKNDSLAKFAAKGWTCDVCLVPNEDDSDKCVACMCAKPGAKPTLAKNDSLAKFAAKGWTCDICLVSNKDDADKCVACTTARPGAKKSLTKSQSGSTDSLQSVFKKPSGNWECDVCLVPNKAEVTKCIACESPRPGTQPSSSGGFKITPGAFSGQSGFVTGSGSNSNANSGFNIGGDGGKSGTGFKFGGDSSTSQTATGFKFGSSSVKSSEESDKVKSGFGFQNSVSESKNTSTTGGFVYGKSTSSSQAEVKQTDSGFKFGESSVKSSDNSVFVNSASDSNTKPSVGGFTVGKPNSLLASSDKLDYRIGKPNMDSIITTSAVNFGKSDSEAKLSVTTSTIATTGIAFSSESEAKSTTSTIPGGFNFGQSLTDKKVSTSLGQQSNGGFVFDQTSSSNKDNSTSDLQKTSIVNSVFGTNSSNKTDNSNSIFGSDPKMSINNFTGTNNSGFAFNKQEETKALDSQPLKVSPRLKRGRDDETGQNESKKPFAPPSTSSSSSLFQFGAKFTASTSASTGVFAFGQNKDSKPTGFSAPSYNFGGPSTTSSTAFSAVPQPTNTSSSLFNAAGPTMSTGAVFGNAAAATSASTGASFVFGASSTKSTTSTTTSFGTPQQQTTSIFGNNGTSFGSTTSGVAPAFGNSGSNPSFGSAGSVTAGGFGSTAPSFGSSTANPPFGAPPTSSAPSFGAPQSSSIPAFGKPQTTTPSFGTPQTSSGPVFGAPPAASAQGGFNFSATPSFNFGQPVANTVQPTANVFQFGGSKPAETSQQTAATAPQTGGFNFGQTASTPVGAPFGFNATPAPAATPSFGGSGFGQPSTPQQGAAGIFNIGASGNTENRKMKKAVRKIRR